MSKRPDSEVWDETTGRHDAAFRSYPTTVGSANFSQLEIRKAGPETKQYFKNRIDEIQEEFRSLQNDLVVTETVFSAEYSFQPLERTTYYLYVKEDGTKFLSLIEPHQWKRKLVYAVQLQSTGIWKIVKE